QACPWVLGRTVRGLRNGPSPRWLADRLVAIGLRPINTLVDITNFFTFDLGRPLHVFDGAKLTGPVLTLRPGAGETFRGLHGKDITPVAADCVIADAAGVQSLAGVVGGEATGCDEGTHTVFLECALFDPVHVALTGRRHMVHSDARQRFERGIDPALLPAAVEAATRMILELCGGEPSEVTEAGAEPAWQRNATLRFARLATLGGLAVPAEEAVGSLRRLGFSVVERDAERVTVAVPSWRNDIAAPSGLDPAPGIDLAAAAAGRESVEPEADLVEEVLRLRGLDAVPPVSMPVAGPIPRPTLTPRQTRAAFARRVLAARGLLECVTFSFLAHEQAALFGTDDPALRLSNPIAADLDQLRATPVATLALAAARNAARGWPDLGLFEIGPAFAGVAPDAQPAVAAGLRTGSTPRHWLEPARPVDAMDAKADALAVLAALGVAADSLGATADAPAFYHPGQSGVLRQGPRALATFGVLHPRVLAALDLPAPAVALEILLDAIPEPKRRRKGAPDLPAFMPVRRDFAFVVDAAVTAEAVLRAARGAERGLIASVALFDAYRGEKIEAGSKSLGVEVLFQPRERTLTDAEIEAACTKVAAAVARATGGRLR
ncbi:MAG: phenylalanine--tRNA ligase subunit beta, partial [Alphaproteobacteria bacterium]|nr:phenylalanine--tRNA ligase subunit beta [Alphaproteobacteria bacterium]